MEIFLLKTEIFPFLFGIIDLFLYCEFFEICKSEIEILNGKIV